ncbi:MAG: hypothetical protein R3C56_33260 [Pirellulaceae bacterium]
MSTFDYQRHFGIDRLLSLEHLTAMELARAIRNSESITLEHFAGPVGSSGVRSDAQQRVAR